MICLSLNSNDSSTGSIVVPAIGETTERSSPKIALSIEDFPTFTLPIIATLILFSSISVTSSLTKSSSDSKE